MHRKPTKKNKCRRSIDSKPAAMRRGHFFCHISDQQAFCPANRKYIQNVHDPSLDKCMNSYYTALHMTSRGARDERKIPERDTPDKLPHDGDGGAVPSVLAAAGDNGQRVP